MPLLLSMLECLLSLVSGKDSPDATIIIHAGVFTQSGVWHGLTWCHYHYPCWTIYSVWCLARTHLMPLSLSMLECLLSLVSGRDFKADCILLDLTTNQQHLLREWHPQNRESFCYNKICLKSDDHYHRTLTMTDFISRMTYPGKNRLITLFHVLLSFTVKTYLKLYPLICSGAKN